MLYIWGAPGPQGLTHAVWSVWGLTYTTAQNHDIGLIAKYVMLHKQS